MTAYDPQIIAKRLNHLEEVISKLEKERPLTVNDLSSREALSDATFYRIQTGIEAIVDIGSHILTEIYNKQTDTYKGTLRELGMSGVLSEDLVRDNIAMVDFRNILVHHYVDIDPEKALINIQKAPEIFQQFAKEIAEFQVKSEEH